LHSSIEIKHLLVLQLLVTSFTKVVEGHLQTLTHSALEYRHSDALPQATWLSFSVINNYHSHTSIIEFE